MPQPPADHPRSCLHSIWQRLQAGLAWAVSTTDAQNASSPSQDHRAYVTRLVLFMMSVTLIGFTLPIAAGGIIGMFAPEDAAIMLFLDLPVLVGWWLARRGRWRISRYIPSFLFLLLALYNSALGGLVTTFLLFYAISIVLSAMLVGGWMPWLVLAGSIAGNTFLGWRADPRPLDTLLPPVLTISGCFLGLALVQWAYTRELQRALARARQSAADLRAEIAERQRAQVELRESEQFSRTVLQNLPIGLSVRSRTGQLLYFNAAWQKIWAMPEQTLEADLTRERSRLAFDEKDDYLKPHQNDLKRVYEQGGSLYLSDLHLTQPRPGGAQWLAQHFIALKDDHDQVERVVILTEDSTERKQSERVLRESEQRYRRLAEDNARLLEQARQDAQAKTRLLQEVNHRVKNNLAAIIGLIRAEQRYAAIQSEPDHESTVEHLVSRIEGLAMAHDLLSAAEWAPLPLDELARRVTHGALRALPQGKTVQVQVSPSAARVTPRQANGLALIINELTINTIKHALADRAAARIDIRIDQQRDDISLEFRNDGPPYPASALQDQSQTLGLYLIRNIAQHDLRGEVALVNDPGPVTRLRFAQPMTDPVETPRVTPAA